MKIKRRTLIIGLGGTGCAALRVTKQRLLDRHILPSGSYKDQPIRFVPVDLDEQSAKLKGGALIDDEFVLARSQLVNEKIKFIDRPENSIYWSWYPDKDRKYINLRAAQAGAAQWRPLGRLAFCEEQKQIERAIRDALSELASLPSIGSREIDTIILSSLAGGTGSGMLLDVIYFLQSEGILKIAGGSLPTAAFLLLPSTFQKTDSGHRTESNTYATLKELASFYRQKRDFEIHYPTRVEPYKVPAGSVVPLSNIFLFDAQLPSRMLETPQMCFEYIGNTAFLRIVTDVGAARSVFSNEKVPSKPREGEPSLRESGFVFSSCSGALFAFPDQNDIIDALFRECSEELAEQIATDLGSSPDKKTLDVWGEDIRAETIFNQSFLNISSIAEDVSSRVSREIGLAQAAINHDSLAELRKACSAIENLDLNIVNDSLEQKFLSFCNQIESRLFNKDSTEKAKDVLNLTLLARRIKILRSLLEERLTSLAPPPQGLSANPLVAMLERIRSTRENLENLKFFSLRPLKISRFNGMKPSLGGAFGEDEFRRRALQKISSEMGTLDSLVKTQGQPTAWHQYLAELSQKTLSIKLVELIKIMAKNEEIISSWLEAIREKQRELREVAAQANEDPIIGNALNIAWISSRQLVAALSERKHEIMKGLHEDIIKEVMGPPESWRLALPESSKLDNTVDKIIVNLKLRVTDAVNDKGFKVDKAVYEKALEGILDNARILLFDNRIPNDCQESIVFYFRPPEVPLFWTADEIDGVDEQIKQRIRRVFPGAEVARYDSDDPYFVIYHETHYHPAENISAISQLHDAYQTVPFPTSCLHVHKDYASLTNLLDQIITAVMCGNPGCNFNIAGVPRDVFFCPNCSRSILNRCGNSDCTTDNLLEKLGGFKHLELNKTMCPGCNQQIRSFWWHCGIHGPQFREKAERFCPSCNEAVRQQTMAFSEKTMQDRGRPWQVYCARCKDEKRVDAFVLPLPELYNDVPKHRVPLLLDTIEKLGPKGNICPKCGTPVFPECPYSSDSKHFVTCGSGGRLTCNNYDAHGETTFIFDQCLNCLFPLTGNESICPRCNLKLLRCEHCTDENGFLIPERFLGPEERCPVCGYEVNHVTR